MADTKAKPAPERERMRTPVAAEYVGCSTEFLEKLRATDKGPRFIKLGKLVLYDRRDLDAWLNASKRVSIDTAAAA